MKWGGGAFAIIEHFAIWGLSQKREVTHSYLVAHTLPYSKEVQICTPLRASILSRPTVVKCDTC